MSAGGGSWFSKTLHGLPLGARVAVRDFLATVTSDELAAPRANPWNEPYQQTTLSCLHVILEEEWEHHRYAVRDLDAIEAKSDA